MTSLQRTVFRPADIPVRERGHVTLYSPESEIRVALRNRERPQVTTERAGGYAAAPRPGSDPNLTFSGTPDVARVQLQLYADDPASIAGHLEALRLLARRDPKLRRTPKIRVLGAVPLAANSPTDWVISALTITVTSSLRGTGEPTRATIDVEIAELPAADVQTRRLQATGGLATYRWKKSDTLASVARAKLGDERRAEWIRDANPKIKSWAKLKAGTRIKLPRRLT